MELSDDNYISEEDNYYPPTQETNAESTPENKKVVPYKKWINSKHIYTARFGIRMLMNEYLDADFKVEYLKLVASVNGDDYYVSIAIDLFSPKGRTIFIINSSLISFVEPGDYLSDLLKKGFLLLWQMILKSAASIHMLIIIRKFLETIS